MHKSVTPVWCASESHALCTSAASNLAQCCIYELFRVGHQGGGLANLGHGRSDEVRLNALNVHAVGFEFGSECC